MAGSETQFSLTVQHQDLPRQAASLSVWQRGTNNIVESEMVNSGKCFIQGNVCHLMPCWAVNISRTALKIKPSLSDVVSLPLFITQRKQTDHSLEDWEFIK